MKTKNMHNVVRQESAVMVALERRLHDAGLVATAALVNEATKRLGWEAARKIEAKK